MKENGPISINPLLSHKKALAHTLLPWYHKSKRDMPWRHTRDPYAIWLSETMLQQTQVETVKPFYHKFLQRFPTLPTLAAADLQEVLTLWAGLGYYRRARNLHAAAQKMVAEHQGKVPVEMAQLLALPGVGRYTAGAVASIAFGLPVPVLDGNVMRVFARLAALDDDIALAQVQKRLWVMAEKLVDEQHPGDYNQALMELGATVCTPRQPRCISCPLKDLCVAYKAGRQDELPVKGKKGAVPTVSRTVVVLSRTQNDPKMGGKVPKITQILLWQRPQGGVWEELWEFPALKTPEEVNPLTQIADALQRSLGAKIEIAGCGDSGGSIRGSQKRGSKKGGKPQPIRVRQRLTHRLMDCQVYLGRVIGETTEGGGALPVCELAGRPYQAACWINPERLADLPVTQLTRKIAQAAGLI